MKKVEDLSPEQQEVVNSWGQGLAVLAGAGSGKTTTLTVKCAELVRLNPAARFAAVSFTERSASDLRAKLTEGLGSLQSHWVMTIHGLCSTLIREFPREAGYDGEETMLSEPEAQLLWERVLESLWLDEELRPEVRQAVDRLLARETRDKASGLLRRVRDLHSFGVLDHLERSEDPFGQALAVAGRFAMERFERLKRRRGALDFADLELGADRVLASRAVREGLHRRFDLVLVDEFQDTNPVQARILERLVRPDFSNLCVVGDPKQSIYRFRDADVSLFEEFCARLPVNKTLSWNFRSRPGIIDFANHLCAQAFEASTMRYDPLEPRREPGPETPVVRLSVSDPKELAAWIRAENERGVPLHDMALLVRKIRGNQQWLKALTAAGIPIAVGSGGLFWSDPRVRELASFLRWWDNPGNSLAGAVFMRAPWMAVPDETLDAWVRKDPTLREPFFASSHPVARRLKALRGRIVRPGELLLELLATEAIEDELGAPLLGLWHRAEDLSARGLDFHAVVGEIAERSREERRERDVPPPRNQGQLAVLTLHGSKGLEFKHVILIDLGKRPRAGETPLLFWDRERGVYLGGRDEDGERDKSHPIEVQWRETEKRKNLAESKRVFYVALTRAQERLILVTPAVEGYELPSPETAFAQDDWRAWVETAFAQQAVPVVAAPEAASASPAVSEVRAERGVRARLESPKLVRPRHSVTEWNLLSRCERAYEWTFARPVARPSEEGLFAAAPRPTAEQAELDQRELGTRVHGCLERGDEEGLRQLEREAGARRFEAAPLIAWARESEWMRPSDPATGREVWTELAFEVPVTKSAPGGPAPEVLVGSLDRLVRAPDGTYTIVDFKVTTEPKEGEELIQAYGTQMELYAFGLRRLDPDARDVRALLVNISPGAVQCVGVPLGRLDAGALGARAAGIVAGEAGRAVANALCRYCDFRYQCEVGRHVKSPRPLAKRL